MRDWIDPAQSRLRTPLLTLGTVLLLILSSLCRADARREVWTGEQKEKLRHADRLWLETILLTSKGAEDRAAFELVLSERLKSLGYSVVLDPAQPYDVAVKVKCEERKTWEGPLRSGGDADQPDAAARLWKGPACQVGYRLGQQWADWRHEVRTDDPNESGSAATGHLLDKLREDELASLLAAEWNQTERLLARLNDDRTPASQRAALAMLLGNMFAVDAIPALGRAAENPQQEVAQAALLALGQIGHQDAIPLLLAALDGNESARLAAIKGLGRLAALHPTSDIVPTLLGRLPGATVREQIELVRSLGRTTDRRILPPLKSLNRSVQERTRSDSGRDLKELKVALGQALDQFDGTHTEE
jgi:hypothetical protein